MFLREVVTILYTVAICAIAAPQGFSPPDHYPGKNVPASITQLDGDPVARAQALAIKKAGYQYAPSLVGNASFHLGGTLGATRIQADVTSWLIDRNRVNASLETDLLVARAAVTINQGLHSLEDYARVLYQNQWKLSVPGSEAPGMLTNFTQDLLFSMERLSLNPYPLRRLKKGDRLPFDVPFSITRRISIYPLEVLKSAGRLFVVDHSYQSKYAKTSRYGGACTAYFFIHPKSGDFLPLAIKTNTGSDLIYTPLDAPNDWLLAKMMFNVNDLFHSQIYHLIASHDIGEPVHEAALRTLSDNHPVLLILDRLMVQAYAIRPVGERSLFNPGGLIDQAFHCTHVGARQYVNEFYPTLGSFQGGYLENYLQLRGLINPAVGPNFKNFPFYADTLPLRNTIRGFMTSFVNSYYPTDATAYADTELQAWFLEATNGAKVIDFPQCGSPQKPCNRRTLIDVLTHFAFLTGVAHHSLNTGDPVATRATLPFHPASLYAPIPTKKGVTDILPFLPPARAALFHVATFAFFNRPYFESQNRTLVYAFSDKDLLRRLDAQTGIAAAVFRDTMKSISRVIRARRFDANGLSLGMPFVWRALDPGTIPFFFAV